MEDKKTKILMVLGSLQFGGAEVLCLTILQNIDRSKYQIDFAVTKLTGTTIENEAIRLGSNIHIVPKFKGYNLVSFKRGWKQLLKDNHYDIVHGHASGAMSIYLSIAKKSGCKTVAHSHASLSSGNIFVQFVKKILAIRVPKKSDYKVACSKIAAIKLFGKNYNKQDNYLFIPNGIDASKFLFNHEIRNGLRQKLGINGGDLLIGNIGRFTEQKNQLFLLDIFSKVIEKQQSSYLLLCGEGPLKDSLMKKAEKLNILNHVLFIGTVPNVNEYMSAMDLFVLPSLYEGLPVTMVEAQASGLPVVCSDEITREVKITDGVKYLSLREGSSNWADEILISATQTRNRFADNETVKDSQFNVESLVRSVEFVYESVMKGK